MEKNVETPHPCRRVGRTDRNHLDLEVLRTASMPCLTHGIPLQQAKHPKALNPTDVKPRRTRPRPVRTRQQHVGTERLVTTLGYTTVGEKSFASARKRDDVISLPHLPFDCGIRSFFYRARPRDAQSCGDVRRCHTPWPPSRQSRGRSSGALHALLCAPTAPPHR